MGIGFSKEQRALAAAKAAAKIASMKKDAVIFRQDFLDESYWRKMASKRGIRLPAWHLPPKPRFMKRYLKRVGLTIPEYKRWSGEKTLEQFSQRNPTWPLWAWVGLLLESDLGTNWPRGRPNRGLECDNF